MIPLFGRSQIMNHDEQLTVERDGEVVYADGKPIRSDLQTFIIRCNVQPLNGKELLLVPEGDRNKEQYWVFSQNGSIILINDRFQRLGGFFQVQSLENWGSYQRARIVRVDVGPEATN